MTTTPAEPGPPAARRPVPGLEWRPPYCHRIIRRNTETELRHGSAEHWYKVSPTPHPYPSVTAILGVADISSTELRAQGRRERALRD